MFTIERYVAPNGVDIFGKWLRGLRDDQARARIIRRIFLLERGGFGDCKPLRAGVWELRIDHGPGYRVYYGMSGKTLILLLCGGDKRTQAHDIDNAITYFNDYKKRC